MFLPNTKSSYLGTIDSWRCSSNCLDPSDVDDWHFSRLILLLAEDLGCGVEESCSWQDLEDFDLAVKILICGVGANRT